MIVGAAKEIKKQEYRVALTPEGAGELVRAGAVVLVETQAGAGSGFQDQEYAGAGAVICSRERLFEESDLIVKVKEPQVSEYELLREGQALFTYLHLAADPMQTDALLARKVTGFAYETLEAGGALPLLAPMSEVAGRMAPLIASYYLQKPRGGPGLLPSGAAGVAPGRCVVLGAGSVGQGAARVALGIGMDVVVLNRGIDRLRHIDEVTGGRVRTAMLTAAAVEREVLEADIVVGALLVPGGRTPVFIPRTLLSRMKRGAVIVDVSVDQGGCAETTVPRTHDDPVYDVDGITHYTVANMPGAFPRTSTIALTNATLPWIAKIAQAGVRGALEKEPALRKALNVHVGSVTNAAVCEAQHRTFVPYSA
jgi:alanine dehydrogenase